MNKNKQLELCPKCNSELITDDIEPTGDVIITRIICGNTECNFRCSELYEFKNWESA